MVRLVEVGPQRIDTREANRIPTFWLQGWDGGANVSHERDQSKGDWFELPSSIHFLQPETQNSAPEAKIWQ